MGWLVRTRLTSMCLVALLFALVSVSSESMSAQSSSTAPAEGQTAPPPPNMPSAASVKAPPPADPAKQFSKAVQIVEKRGRRSHLPDYIADDLGLPRTGAANQQPVGASVLDIDSARRIYLIDDSDAAVMITAANESTMVYLIRSGVLKKAGQMKSGRWGSMSVQNVPLASAAAGFNAERDLWIEQLAAKFPAESRSK